MQEDDELIIEEARRQAREFLDKMAADGDRIEHLEHSAFIMFLVIERGFAKRRSISGPSERDAIVAGELARIAGGVGNKS